MTAGLSRPLICLVTDRRRVVPAGIDSLLRLVGRAATAGVDIVHVREPGLDDRQLVGLVNAAVEAVAATAARVVVNDRVDIALAARAHGVHLRADSINAALVRQLVPPGFLVGQSIHTRPEAVAAAGNGVDYLVAGTVYPTASKRERWPLLGVSGLRELVQAVDVPVLAIGGVVADNVWDIAASGAAGVAAIGLFADVPTDAHDAHFDRALRDLVARLRAPFQREPFDSAPPRSGPGPGSG
jgi:thiamine-phosphate pyrophosphorylase